jgi:hypothetical protein
LYLAGFSTQKAKIGDILINSAGLIDFIAPEFLKLEIQKYHTRLAKVSKLSVDQVIDSEFRVCKDIRFISEEQISLASWEGCFCACQRC